MDILEDPEILRQLRQELEELVAEQENTPETENVPEDTAEDTLTETTSDDPQTLLEEFLQTKTLVPSFTDTRGYYLGEGYLMMEQYTMPSGVLASQIYDFDHDSVPELFTAELTDDTLDFVVYRVSNSKAEESDRVNIGSDLLFDSVTGPQWIHVFLKEHQNTCYVFCQQYATGGYMADGQQLQLQGYQIANGALSEVLNEYDAGSGWNLADDPLKDLNASLAQYGLASAYTNENYVNLDIASRSDVMYLASIDQKYHGSVSEMYKHYSNGAVDLIDPMHLTVQANQVVSLTEAPVAEDGVHTYTIGNYRISFTLPEHWRDKCEVRAEDDNVEIYHTDSIGVGGGFIVGFHAFNGSNYRYIQHFDLASNNGEILRYGLPTDFQGGDGDAGNEYRELYHEHNLVVNSLTYEYLG